MNKAERRLAPRIVIEGAKVDYKLENGDTGSSRLENLTINSVCMQLKQRVLPGRSIKINLIIPKKPVIPIKAKIIWVLPRGGYEEGSNIGVKFIPFGIEKKFNPLEIKKQLEIIIAEYQ